MATVFVKSPNGRKYRLNFHIHPTSREVFDQLEEVVNYSKDPEYHVLFDEDSVRLIDSDGNVISPNDTLFPLEKGPFIMAMVLTHPAAAEIHRKLEDINARLMEIVSHRDITKKALFVRGRTPEREAAYGAELRRLDAEEEELVLLKRILESKLRMYQVPEMEWYPADSLRSQSPLRSSALQARYDEMRRRRQDYLSQNQRTSKRWAEV